MRWSATVESVQGEVCKAGARKTLRVSRQTDGEGKRALVRICDRSADGVARQHAPTSPLFEASGLLQRRYGPHATTTSVAG